MERSGNLAGAIPTLQKSAGAVSAAQSKQACGAVPHGTSSLIHCHDTSGPVGTSEFETSVLPGGDAGKTTASQAWTSRPYGLDRPADDPGWKTARNRVAFPGTSGTPRALEGQSWERAQLWQRACELWAWHQAGEHVSRPGAAGAGTASHRTGGRTCIPSLPLPEVGAPGCFLGCPRDGTRGFRTPGSSAPFAAGLPSRAPPRAGSHLAAASSREGLVRGGWSGPMGG